MSKDLAGADLTIPGDGRIPVCLLTGFLGAGKTTILNHLVHQPGMQGTALLINEFGEIGIDHHLVETVDETILLLDSGCLCCSMRGDFVETLKSLHGRLSRREIPEIRRVMIETTGLADPIPIIYTLMEDPYVSARYVCDSVLTVVDARLGANQLGRHPEAVRQVAMADRLLITKTDICDHDRLVRLDAWLNTLNPSAQRIRARHGEVDPKDVFSGGVYSTRGRIADVADWFASLAAPHTHHEHGHDHHHHHHHHNDIGSPEVGSFTVCFERPVPWRGLAVTMGQILQEYGGELLRAKGVIAVAGSTSPVVIQCVQDVAYPAVQMARWPSEGVLADRKGRLVFIGIKLNATMESDIRRRLAALPDDSAAMRKVAGIPMLPTRCWLGQRLPWMGKGAFETAGWVIQPPPFRSVGNSQR
jgi:G3E family GTPase